MPSDLCVHALAHVTPPNMTVVTLKTKELGEMDTFLRRQRLHGIIPAETQAEGSRADVLRSEPVTVPMLRVSGSPERAPHTKQSSHYNGCSAGNERKPHSSPQVVSHGRCRPWSHGSPRRKCNRKCLCLGLGRCF